MTQNHTHASSRPLRLSIALCTYNGARHLDEQLQSFTGQQRLPDEVILCDDGSTDGTVDVAEAFARNAPFEMRVVRNPKNLGYNRNFAQAVSLCRGDVIALSDQDDVWFPQKLARLEQLFLDHPEVDGIFSNGELMDSASRRLPGDLWGSFQFGAEDQQRINSGQASEAIRVLLQRNVVTGMAFAFRGAWKNSLRSMPASWPHDAWLALLLALQGKLLACPEPLVAYRVHENQKIGVPITSSEKWLYLRKHGLDGYLGLSRRRNLEEYQGMATQFEDLLRVATTEPAEDVQRSLLPILDQIRAKAAHARTSAALLGVSRMRRLFQVLPRRSQYARYSPTGVQAMIRDLVL